MTEEIFFEYHVSAFRGKPPEIDVADGVDLQGIHKRDPDAMFVTLPIAEVGAISANGLLYDEALVHSIVEQVNSKRPGGTFGHLKDDERGTSFPLPAGLWVGAKLIDGTAWAKSYIPPGAARDYVHNLKSVGGEIATSIYGRGERADAPKGSADGVHRRVNFKLESLDFAPPSRAALGMGAIPHVTTEMEQEQEPNMTKEELLQELLKTKVEPQRGWTPVPATQPVAELTQIRETLGVDGNANLVQLVQELRKQTETLTKAAIATRITELVSEGVKLEGARGIVSELIKARNPQTVEEAEEAYQSVIEMQAVKEILTAALHSATGPAAIVNGRVRETSAPKLEDTPETRQAEMNRMGIQI